MNDFDFLKEFGKDLDRERLHEGSEADWHDLETRLDARDQTEKRRRRWARWWFPLCVAAGFAWLGTAFWQVEQQTEALKIEVETLKTALSDRPAQADTLRQKITVVQFDTIFRTVIVRREMHAASTENQHFDGQATDVAGHFSADKMRQARTAPVHLLSEIGANTGTDASIKNEKTGEPNAVAPAKNTPVLVENSTQNEANQSEPSLAPLPTAKPKPVLFLRKNDPPDVGLLAPVLPVKTATVPRFRVRDAAVGLRVGAFLSDADHTDERGFSIGLAAEKAIAPRLRLTAGADFGHLFFKLKPNDLGHFNLPSPPPPVPGDVLRRVFVRQPVGFVSLGLRFDFLPEKRLRPFVSAAWLGEINGTQSLRYEYQHPLTKDNSQVLVRRDARGFDARGAQIGLGTDWHFAHRWSVGADGFYQHRFDDRMAFSSQRWGLRTGLKFHF